MSLCGDGPDTSGMNKAAVDSAQLSRDAYEWYTKAYADQAPARAAAEAKATEVADAQIEAMKTATAQAKDIDAYNKGTFRPLEQRMVTEAQAYDTPQRRMQAATEAAADVDRSAAAVQQAQDMALQRTGIAPGSARALAVRQDRAGDAVAARAAAMTGAVRNVEQQGYSRMADMVNLGRGLPSQQATQQQIATTAGNSGVNASGAALGAAMSGNATMGQGFQTALQGQQIAGNLYGQAAQIDAQSQGGLMGGLVGLGSVAARFYNPTTPTSDQNVKKRTGRMVDKAQALKQVERTPVEADWKYDQAKGGPDDGGVQHDGPMAQQVRKTMGEAAAPGGKVIDLVTMNGRMMAAIQQLSKEVKALKKADAKEDEKEAA